MINIKRISAFSLTELLIALMVVAFLFAAMAPIVTKRRLAHGDWMNESVWNYVSGDSNRDAYYDPGVTSWSSIAFVGINPSAGGISSDAIKYGGKLTIMAASGQRHLQFRYGSNIGTLAGTFTVGDNSMLMGSGFDDNLDGAGNTVAGYGAAGKIKEGSLQKSTIIGSYALFQPKYMDKGMYITAVGTNAAKELFSNFSVEFEDGTEEGTITPTEPNTFIGSNAGRTNATTGSIGIGYNSLYSLGGYSNYENTAVGAKTGQNIANGYSNVLAGTSYSPIAGYGNTIIGYGAYEGSGDTGRGYNKITAVGYNACNAGGAYNTCIGKNSGSVLKSTQTAPTDGDHIYIGGIPHGGFKGHAVLEVNNNTGTRGTVELNSNLVLRGALYLDNNGKLAYNLNEQSEKNGDRVVIEDKRSATRTKWVVDKRMDQRPYSWNKLRRSQPSRDVSGFSYTMSGDYPNLKSDIRLKENLSESDAGLAEIMKLEPYNYTFKSDKDKIPQVGVIAQDLIKVFPNSVTKANDGYFRIRWDEMFYAMINAIKTLNQKVERLASDIKTMCADTHQLENNNKLIKKRIADLNSRAARLERK